MSGLKDFGRIFWHAFCETPRQYFLPVAAFWGAVMENATGRHYINNHRHSH